MNARASAVAAEALGDPFDFEPFFHAHYERIARVAARVVRDPARAEAIALGAFWKLWRRRERIRGESAGGWIYRTAVRLAMDELRRDARRLRRESRPLERDPVPNPEETHSAAQRRDRVRLVLASLETREAELLLLRGNDLSYAEVAAALELNPASVGTLISRAQAAFRKEYVKRYGEPEGE